MKYESVRDTSVEGPSCYWTYLGKYVFKILAKFSPPIRSKMKINALNVIYDLYCLEDGPKLKIFFESVKVIYEFF